MRRDILLIARYYPRLFRAREIGTQQANRSNDVNRPVVGENYLVSVRKQ